MAHYLEVLGVILALYLVQTAYTFLSLRYRINKASREHGCKPVCRYPNTDLLGLDLGRLSDKARKEGKSFELFSNLHRKYGDTFEHKLRSYNRRLSTCNPKNIQAIGSTNFDDWGVEPIRGNRFAPFMGQGIFMNDGEVWKRSRAMVRPTFNKTEIADLENFEVYVNRFLALVPRDGRTVDLQPLFKRLFLDTSSEFIFGRSVNSLLPDTTWDAAEFMTAFDACLLGLGLRFRPLVFRPLSLFDRSFKRAYTKVHAFIDEQIRAALGRQSALPKNETKSEDPMRKRNKYILLDGIIQHTQDVYAIRHQIINVFFPARDTSPMAMTNVMFELARHPQYWDQLQAEIKSLGNRSLTFEVLKNLKVAKAIVSESLRHHLPAIALQRIALRDTILPAGGGRDQLSPLFVPKGTIISVQMYAVHHNPNIWGDDVDEFKPERWDEGRPLWEAKWQYVPFFGGIRMCPAQQQVLTQITYLLVRLAQEFKGLENRDEVDEWFGEVKMTVQSRNGAKVSLTPA